MIAAALLGSDKNVDVVSSLVDAAESDGEPSDRWVRGRGHERCNQ